ncbi:hypothetical protein [Mucilaginibacter sp.]|jgi:hypothetical protein|uniref:hypothetical protein n=1 Tax=Mucilaginibacter sp. TaxID=1882438 RepID=UPI003561C050
MRTVDFDNLVDSEATLYLCMDNNSFQLGSVVFEVIEDESDGYRSAMSEVTIVNTSAKTDNPLDTVKIHKADDCYLLTSTITGHVWLQFGTDYSDSYYPCFVFAWEAYDDSKFYETLKSKIK